MQFYALTDLYLADGRYISAGETFDVPSDFKPPTNAVSPISPDAIEALWLEGPRGCSDAEPNRAVFTNSARWSDKPVKPPSVRWVPANPQKPSDGFVLQGGGENYGVHPQV